MPLETVTAAILAQMAQSGAPELHQMTAAESRAMYRDLKPDIPLVDVYRVEDRSVPGPAGEIPVRIYWPTAAPAATATREDAATANCAATQTRLRPLANCRWPSHCHHNNKTATAKK